MEKIYMENNQNQKQKKTFNMLNVTVGLSFAIAFIAVASILLVVAFKPSYSYEKLDTLPKTVNVSDVYNHLRGDGSNNQSPTTFLFNLSYNGGTAPGICLEYEAPFGGYAGDLTAGDEEINDVGLIYLIQKLDELDARIKSDYQENNSFECSDPANHCSADNISAWVRQNAIWEYQATKYGDNQSEIYGQISTPDGDHYFNNIGNRESVVVRSTDYTGESYTCPGGCKWFERYGVTNLVSEALNKQGTLDDVSITVSVANEGNSQWVESGDFYRTGKISVDTIGSGSKVVSASLSGIDKAKLYGCPASGDCKEITDLSNISLGDYDHFRVYVPKDAVSTEKKNVTVVFKYNFDVLSGYYYKADGHQTVTILGTIPKEVSKGLDFTIVKVPDTATDISGTIYVVGLIVLLSGLGILYINVRKQKTQTQQ